MKIPLQQYWSLLVGYLRPQQRRVLLLGLLLLGNIALQLINPQIIGRFIDTAQAGGAPEALLRMALLFMGVALAQQVVSVLATYTSENVGWTATNLLRADLAEHCLGLDMGFHNAHTPGEMIERLDGDVGALANFFSQFVIQVLGNALLLVGALVLLLREDWRIGSSLAVFALLAMLVLVRLQNVGVPHWAAERQASAELFGFLEERLSGTEDIRANGAQAYTLRNFFRLMREQMKRALRAGLMVNILINSSMFLGALGMAAAFALGAYLFHAGRVTLGSVYMVFQYTLLLQRPVELIARQMQELQRAGAGISRIEALLQTQSAICDDGAPATLPAGPLALRFEGVSFGYNDGPRTAPAGNGPGAEPEQPPECDGTRRTCETAQEQALEGASDLASEQAVLHNITFALKPGTVLGLLGRTGSGKSTLIRLLFRFYEPNAGAIYMGTEEAPVDIRRVPTQKLRQRIGLVTQEIQLLHATVRDNLTFFDDTVPDARIRQVLDELGLGEWLRALPAGLDTVLESGGGGLSAGQAQLLAFARVFLQDPGLVILDEASSRLDPASERLIERAVEKLVRGAGAPYGPAAGRTAIIIAHRLGTVQRADEIMILEQGQVCEQGPRSALAADPGSRFHHLLQQGLEEVLV